MEEKVNKILDLMISGLEKAGSVADAELPGLLQEYATYLLIRQFPIISFSMLIGTIALFFYVKKQIYRSDCIDQGLAHAIALMVAVVIGTISVMEFGNGIRNSAAIYFSPKAALIENLRR